MKKILSVSLLLASGPLMANEISAVSDKKFKILSATEVSVDHQECIVGFRKEFSQEEMERKKKFSCYGLNVKNATIELDNGEIITVEEIKTQPMMEVFGGVSSSLDCAEAIAESMMKYFNGHEFPKGEKFKMPNFTSYGVSGDTLHVATAKNEIFGVNSLGRESFTYRNKSEKTICHPQIGIPNISVVENIYDEPTKDEGILRNMGRNARGLGFELIRAGEAGTEWVGDKLGVGSEKR